MAKKKKSDQIDQNGNTNPADKVFNDSKAHYESVLSYFKYMVTLTGIFLTIIVATITYTTYKDSSEMKAEMKEKANDLKNDFKEKEAKVDSELEKLKIETAQTIQSTKLQALSEIGYIRNDAKIVAISEANRKVEEVFANNNIELYIVNAAKNYLKPELTKIINSEKSSAIDTAIKIMKIGNFQSMQSANIIFEQAKSFPLNIEQSKEIIQIVKSTRYGFMRRTLTELLSNKKSEEITEAFLYVLDKEGNGSISLMLLFII